MQNSLIWFGNDLRLSDNLSIYNASQNDEKLLFLYIFDEIDQEQVGSASKWFLHQALDSLSKDLIKSYGAKLVVKQGNAQNILDEITQKYKIDNIYWNRNYEPKKIKRNSNIKSFFKKKNINASSHNTSLLFEPSKILNLSGQNFKVFTPFWKHCIKDSNEIQRPVLKVDKVNLIKPFAEDINFTIADLNLLPKRNWADNWGSLWNVSEDQLHNHLDDFFDNKIINYKSERDFPAINATSKISAFLHYGLVSPRQLFFKNLPYLDTKGGNHFLSEIGWREFSYNLLYFFPELDTKNFKSNFDKFSWQNDTGLLDKWKKGKTGFPIIDAGMRQLYQTGWMHNRLRMIVGSFLVKNLLIDWRYGLDWFNDCLIDADLASNSASWQWVAGSGADAAPYFRIFNPLIQSQKFDKDAIYIKTYVSELQNSNIEDIHQAKCDYIEPIIDLSFSRKRALEFYDQIK